MRGSPSDVYSTTGVYWEHVQGLLACTVCVDKYVCMYCMYYVYTHVLVCTVRM